MKQKSNGHITSKQEVEDFEQLQYIFQLFVSGDSAVYLKAISNIRAIFEKYLKGRYKLEIIDILKQPELALSEQIIALPALLKKFPLPQQRMVGDFTDVNMVLKSFYLNTQP